jgi:gas vesicle protein
LLFAPKAGQELRSDIAGATRAGVDKTEAMASRLSGKANAVYEDTTAKAGEIYDSAKQKINAAATALSEMPGHLQEAVLDKVEQISSTIEVGKKEYDRENSALSNTGKAKAAATDA